MAFVWLDLSELTGDLYPVTVGRFLRCNAACPPPPEEIAALRELRAGESCFLSIGGGAVRVTCLHRSQSYKPYRSERETLAQRANELGRTSARAGAPVLTADSSVETIAAWLQWCDPNGCHTAELALGDGCEPYDAGSVWEALAEMLSGA